jgi:hypothetical protein
VVVLRDVSVRFIVVRFMITRSCGFAEAHDGLKSKIERGREDDAGERERVRRKDYVGTGIID